MDDIKKYFRNVWLGVYTIAVGMRITFSHLFKRAVTIQYPDERLQLPERERNRLFVNIDDCIGCDQCARACPVNCIHLDTVKALPGDVVGRTGVTSNGKKKALFVPTFTIDIAKCCYCQLCVFPCPTECIYMTDVFEFSEYDRNKFVYEFTDMTPEQVDEKKRKLEEFNKEQEEKKAAAAKAKAEEASAKAEADEAAKQKQTAAAAEVQTADPPEKQAAVKKETSAEKQSAQKPKDEKTEAKKIGKEKPKE